SKSYDRIGADDFTQTFMKGIEYYHSLIFIGFGAGMDDPNFQGFLNWAKGKFINPQTQHFILVKAGEEPKGLPDNITAIVYGEKYEDLPGFLQQLAGKKRRPGRPRKHTKYITNQDEPAKKALLNKLVPVEARSASQEAEAQPVRQSPEGFLAYISSNIGLVKDVMFLSTLLSRDERILALYWPGVDVTLKLRELSEQHPFINNGHVERSDRKKLRRGWEQDHKPIVRELLGQLSKIVETLRVDVNFKTGDYFRWYLHFLTIKCWTGGATVVPDLVKGLLMSVLTGQDCDVVVELAMDVTEFHPEETAFTAFLDNKCFTNLAALHLTSGDLRFLESLDTSNWSPTERVLLYFVLAYSYSDIKDSRMALYYFDMAFAVSDDFFPEMELLTKFYLDAVLETVHTNDSPLILNNCLQWIDKFNFVSSGCYRELAMVYYKATEYEIAVSLWKKHLELEPAHVTTYEMLIETLSSRLQQPQSAIAVFREAPANVSGRPPLQFLIGNCYKALKNYTQAARHYQMATDHAYDAKGIIYGVLAELYASKLNDAHLADTCFIRAIQEGGSNYELLCIHLSYLSFLMENNQPGKAVSLVPATGLLLNSYYHRLPGNVLNEMAWYLYVLDLELDLAEKMSRRAIELEYDLALSVHTLSCILARMNKWKEAKPYILKWLANTEDNTVKERWDEYVLLFRDAVIWHKQELIERLIKNKVSIFWLIIRYALLKTTAKALSVKFTGAIASRVEAVYQQLITKEPPGDFPV
ncbi:hypothetical protein, partial [Chitinophaga sp.]|uniref:hypothetical protein n=1 Tax=Chitinophaga sp. TaxID=1869181 RepID=UPI002C7C2D95